MASIKDRFLNASQAIEKALEEMGECEAAGVAIIDDMDEITGNMKTAELREFFPPNPSRGEEAGELKNHVVLLTSNLGQDFDELEKLTGDNGLRKKDNDGGAPPRGSLHEKFPAVKLLPMSEGIFKAVATMMITESALPPMLQEGLCAIVHEEVIGQRKVNPATGLRGLRHAIDDYLRIPMTPEWEQMLLSRSPTATVINSLGKGTTRKMQAPRTASFKKPPQNGGGAP